MTKKYYNNLCKCGCKGKLLIRYWHRQKHIPKFILGHYIKIKNNNPSNNPEIARKRGLKLEGKKHPKEFGDKIRKSHLGKPMNYSKKEIKRRSNLMKTDNPMFKKKNKVKISKIIKERWKNPTENMLEGIKITTKKISGKNSIRYIHGLGYEPYDNKFTKKLKKQVAERDKYICQVCNKKVKKGACHHIHYIKNDSRIETLVWTHRKCNLIINKHIDYWFVYFCYILNYNPEDIFFSPR